MTQQTVRFHQLGDVGMCLQNQLPSPHVTVFASDKREICAWNRVKGVEILLFLAWGGWLQKNAVTSVRWFWIIHQHIWGWLILLCYVRPAALKERRCIRFVEFNSAETVINQTEISWSSKRSNCATTICNKRTYLVSVAPKPSPMSCSKGQVILHFGW